MLCHFDNLPQPANRSNNNYFLICFKRLFLKCVDFPGPTASFDLILISMVKNYIYLNFFKLLSEILIYQIFWSVHYQGNYSGHGFLIFTLASYNIIFTWVDVNRLYSKYSVKFIQFTRLKVLENIWIFYTPGCLPTGRQNRFMIPTQILIYQISWSVHYPGNYSGNGFLIFTLAIIQHHLHMSGRKSTVQ